jgi:hypothetical protein
MQDQAIRGRAAEDSECIASVDLLCPSQGPGRGPKTRDRDIKVLGSGWQKQPLPSYQERSDSS